MQLQHRSTVYRACRLGRLTLETIPTPPVGVSPLLFRPPDGPAAIDYRDTPPAIAQPSLLRLEIAAGILHRELTPLAHSRRSLARRRPQLYCGVCIYVCVCVCVCVRVRVCVCVCVCVCNICLFNCLSTLLYLRSRLSPSSCTLRCPRYTPTTKTPFLYADNQSNTLSAYLTYSPLVRPFKHP